MSKLIATCQSAVCILRRLLVGLFLLIGLASVQSAEVISVCYESADVMPWRTADGKGLNFDLLQIVKERTGIEFKFTGIPWKRCLAGLQAREYDAAIGASFSPERESFAVYPSSSRQLDRHKRMHTDRYVFLKIKGSSVTWEERKLRGFKGQVGIQLGYSVGADLLALGLEVDDGAQGGRQLLSKLQAGRVDVIAMLEGEARWLLDRDQMFGRLEILSEPINEKDYFLIFSKAYFAQKGVLAEKVWAAIGRSRESIELSATNKPASFWR